MKRCLIFTGFATLLSCSTPLVYAADAPEAFTNTLGMEMVPIPAGSFEMGESRPTDYEVLGEVEFGQHGDWDEQPVHAVEITQPFLMSETEVTAEQFRAFQADFAGVAEAGPLAGGVSWEQARAFCEWLSEKEGKPYRLPTEAEWEYACRAGTDTWFWSGEAPPADGKDTNPWGLRNMHSGVPEWCSDWHGVYPAQAQIDPVGRASGVARVVRGGGLETGSADRPDGKIGESGLYHLRSANRAGLTTDVPHGAGLATVDAGESGKDKKLYNVPTRYGTPPHAVGFRVVQAPMPRTRPLPEVKPFPMQGVKQSTVGVKQGPDPDTPYFQRRPMIPLPPDNDQGGGLDAVGLHPGIGAALHSGGMTVAPNGDLLAVFFSAAAGHREHGPAATMVVTRLRRGAQQWDMPDLFYDLPDLNDQAAMLWNDDGKLWFFGGGRHLPNVPFRFFTSDDSGETWTTLRVPVVTGQVGPSYPQPINSAFRDSKGTIYFGCDGAGAHSFLWASDDESKTWYDTGGRTGGRHTTFVPLRDGRILGLGGKSSDIDGYMPKFYSSDWGKTWTEAQRTPFAALSSNQRPTLIRLKSGRLFAAMDQQQVRMNKVAPPDDVQPRGVIVALSDDEGQTWRTKKLDLAEPHESRRIPQIKREPWSVRADHEYDTIGYCVAAQSPDGVIHLTTSMNHPNLHFAMNEAWILSDETGEANTAETVASFSPADDVERHEETYDNGNPRRVWHGRVVSNGQYVLHGPEQWFYPGGKPQYETTYANGRHVGEETYWDVKGHIDWKRVHDGGRFTWTHYWPNGQKRIESHWRDFVAQGPATHWDEQGNVVRVFEFQDGALVSP